MKIEAALRYGALMAVSIALGMGVYLAKESKATSYMSEKSEACINCHVMESSYAAWLHSSHAMRAECVDCHLPADHFIDKYAAKARDGFNHSAAFTMNTYGKRLLITEDGAERVQQNCIRCHSSFSTTLIKNIDRHHAFDSDSLGGRKCWDCHRQVPHGTLHSTLASPNNLGVRWNR